MAEILKIVANPDAAAPDLRSVAQCLRNLADTIERGPAWLESLLSDLKFAGLIVELDEPYPWHRYALTDAGKAMITQQGE